MKTIQDLAPWLTLAACVLHALAALLDLRR